MLLHRERGDVAFHGERQQHVLGEQPVVAAPALQRHAQGGRGERGAAEHAVAAPGEPAGEPAERLVVELLHGGAGEELHLPRGDPCRLDRRGDLARSAPPGAPARVGAPPLVGPHHRSHEGHGGLGGLGRGRGRAAGGAGHAGIIATWHDLQPPWLPGCPPLPYRPGTRSHTMNWKGLEFDLGETADAMREMVRQFAQAEIAPRAADIDRENHFPMDLWRKMGALGLLGVTVDPEYGGAGMSYLEHVVAMEEISRASAAVGLAYGAHSNLCVNQIHRNGKPGAAAALPAPADLRRARGRAGDERAGRRLRRGLHEAPGRPEGRPLRPERQQDVDHQRPPRRRAGGLRQDRPRGRAAGHHRLHRREGHARLLAPRRSSTSWACAARTPASWSSRTARCRRRTCSARWGGASTC